MYDNKIKLGALNILRYRDKWICSGTKVGRILVHNASSRKYLERCKDNDHEWLKFKGGISLLAIYFWY